MSELIAQCVAETFDRQFSSTQRSSAIHDIWKNWCFRCRTIYWCYGGLWVVCKCSKEWRRGGFTRQHGHFGTSWCRKLKVFATSSWDATRKSGSENSDEGCIRFSFISTRRIFQRVHTRWGLLLKLYFLFIRRYVCHDFKSSLCIHPQSFFYLNLSIWDILLGTRILLCEG